MISYGKITANINGIAKLFAVTTLLLLPISTSATSILFILTTLFIVASGHWKQKYILLKTNPIALCFIGFFLIYLIGASYSPANWKDITHHLARWSWLLLSPLWITIFTEKKWQQRGINFFLAAMIITLILSYAKFFHWIDSAKFWYLLGHRISGSPTSIFKDYLIQSFLMSIAAILFLHRFIVSKQWLYAILFLLAAAHIFLISQARTDYIIFIALVTYIIFQELSFKKALLICSAIAIAMATLLMTLPGPIHKRIQLAAQDLHQWHRGHEKTSLGYRIAWQKNAIKLIKDKPIIGYGTASIQDAFATLPKEVTRETGIVGNASNEYLNIAIQFGIIGLLLFLGMLLLQWRYSFFLPKEQKILIQSLLIALSIGNLANSWLTDFTQGYCYALMMMLSFATLSTHPKPSRAKDHACNDDVATDTPS